MKFADIFSLDPTVPSGLVWKIRPALRCRVGTMAGFLDPTGYYCVEYKGKGYKCHRIIWEMLNGPIPKNYEVDHIDGNRSNNTITNLRVGTRTNNLHNKGLQSNNKSGYKGVSQVKSGKWRALTSVKGKSYHLGYYTTKEEAAAAYAASAKLLHKEFYHP